MQCPNCKQNEDWRWKSAVNNDGWKCDCGFQPGDKGFCPQLDRERLFEKVDSTLCSLTVLSELVYLSNGSEGDAVTDAVVKMCREREVYDQYSILSFILEIETPSHAKYWKEISEGVLSGNDTRSRCKCGELAVSKSAEGEFCLPCSQSIVLV